MTDNPILGKIRKLLAIAEDPATTPEAAENYTAKAAELIAKYGIDAALLAAADPTTDKVGDRVLEMDAPYALDKAQLLHSVATPLRCKTVRHQKWTSGVKQLSMHLFGFGADLDRVELLYTSLLVQAAHALAVAYVPYYESTAAYRRSWYAGYATAIGQRLRVAEARAQADAAPAATGSAGMSVELVLADRTTLVDRCRDAAYPGLKTAPPRRLSGSGTRSGYDAGQRADLGGTRLAAGRARAVGGAK